jgi:aspartyl-tRNA(Asn)/glutamyl-tRNA(Gln) amidotransferase subunit C
MANKLTAHDVAQVAALARLELTAEEQHKLESHLNDILEQFARLQELDTEGVEPTSRSNSARNVFREDTAMESLPRDAATRNAPEKRDGNFIVPQIVDA